MKGMNWIRRGVAAALLFACCGAWATNVVPQFIEGNVTACSAVIPGFDGISVSTGGRPGEGAVPLTWSLGAGQSITFSYNPPGDLRYIDFTSTIPIDAMIIKGSNAANLFVYDPARLSDTDLYSPNNSSGGPATVSHVVICVNPRPVAIKTAAASWTRDTQWNLDKAASPASISMFVGDTHAVQYTVTATPTSRNTFLVSGSITISDAFGHGAFNVTSIVTRWGSLAMPRCSGRAGLRLQRSTKAR